MAYFKISDHWPWDIKENNGNLDEDSQFPSWQSNAGPLKHKAKMFTDKPIHTLQSALARRLVTFVSLTDIDLKKLQLSDDKLSSSSNLRR